MTDFKKILDSKNFLDFNAKFKEEINNIAKNITFSNEELSGCKDHFYYYCFGPSIINITDLIISSAYKNGISKEIINKNISQGIGEELFRYNVDNKDFRCDIDIFFKNNKLAKIYYNRFLDQYIKLINDILDENYNNATKALLYHIISRVHIIDLPFCKQDIYREDFVNTCLKLLELGLANYSIDWNDSYLIIKTISVCLNFNKDFFQENYVVAKLYDMTYCKDAIFGRFLKIIENLLFNYKDFYDNRKDRLVRNGLFDLMNYSIANKKEELLEKVIFVYEKGSNHNYIYDFGNIHGDEYFHFERDYFYMIKSKSFLEFFIKNLHRFSVKQVIEKVFYEVKIFCSHPSKKKIPIYNMWLEELLYLEPHFSNIENKHNDVKWENKDDDEFVDIWHNIKKMIPILSDAITKYSVKANELTQGK